MIECSNCGDYFNTDAEGLIATRLDLCRRCQIDMGILRVEE